MGKKRNEKKLKNIIQSAISILNEQVKKLENQKQAFTESGRQAKQHGLTEQYNIALSGLRTAVARQKRVYSVKLNFELALQLNDAYKTSLEFIEGMQSLSRDVKKLTGEEGCEEAEKLFGEAKENAELLFSRSEEFLKEFDDELIKRASKDE